MYVISLARKPDGTPFWRTNGFDESGDILHIGESEEYQVSGKVHVNSDEDGFIRLTTRNKPVAPSTMTFKGSQVALEEGERVINHCGYTVALEGEFRLTRHCFVVGKFDNQG